MTAATGEPKKGKREKETKDKTEENKQYRYFKKEMILNNKQ